MTLDDLAVSAPRAPLSPGPDWSWGCFFRRALAYASGQEAPAMEVIRLQAQGMTGELRLPAGRPDVAGRGGLHGCSADELLELCAADGGVAASAWSGETLAWDTPCTFQPSGGWPPPVTPRRIGPALIETAAGGAFVQDWRLQPGSGGLMASMRLMFETGTDGHTRPRDGGLLVAGGHGLFCLGRYRPLPSEAPVQWQMRQAGDPHAFADMVFEAETAYARRQPDGTFRVERSTNPFHEGQAIPIVESFLTTSISGVLRQEIDTAAGRIVRQWRVDTLRADAGIDLATPYDPASRAWLERETAPRGL